LTAQSEELNTESEELAFMFFAFEDKREASTVEFLASGS